MYSEAMRMVLFVETPRYDCNPSIHEVPQSLRHLPRAFKTALKIADEAVAHLENRQN